MDSFAILFYILLGLLTTADLPAWVRRGALFPAVGASCLRWSWGCLVARGTIRGPLGRSLPAVRVGTTLTRITRPSSTACASCPTVAWSRWCSWSR